MPPFSLRALLLLAIAAILIFRTVRKFGANRSAKVPNAAQTPSSGNAFCIHCGGPLVSGALFCGGCGVRRS
jgi:alkyl hydroperoxide reductase subunit AhpF